MHRKIAIISSSPLMMMLAFKLQKKNSNQVTIFDSSLNKGGAWAWFRDYKKKYGIYISKYSNVIVPLNKKEETFIKFMNKVLQKDFKVSVVKTKKKIITNYKFKNKFIYNFAKFYNVVNKNLKFRKEFIYKITQNKYGQVILNENKIFDEIYLPSYSGVKKIKILNKNFSPKTRIIVSEHLLILARKFKLENFYYSDFYDNYFDRVKIDKIKNNLYSLTARLTYSIKGQKLSKLKKYLGRFVNYNDILMIKKSKFKNYYRKKDELLTLKNRLLNTKIKYVDTSKFVCGFYYLRNFFIK